MKIFGNEAIFKFQDGGCRPIGFFHVIIFDFRNVFCIKGLVKLVE